MQANLELGFSSMTNPSCQPESQKLLLSTYWTWSLIKMDLGPCELSFDIDLGPFKKLCFILHGLWPRALKQSQDLCLFKIKYHLMTMFLITFWVSWLKNLTLCTWKERFWFIDSNTKISIFIKMDSGLFKIGGYLNLCIFKIGG